MKKSRLSLEEKRIKRTALILVLIQFLIVAAFVYMLNGSHPIDETDIKHAKVTVTDARRVKAPSEFWLIVYSDSEAYVFTARAGFDEAPVSELYETISIGDDLNLSYYESFTILGKTKVIVDARTETEIYRSLEGYNRGKRGVSIAIMVIFSIIELLFVGVVWICFWLNKNNIKTIYRKLYKRKKLE